MSVSSVSPIGSVSIPSSPPVLRLGSKGASVKSLQLALDALGIECAVDGSFGPKTRAAVRTFQARNNLVVDGVVGPQTWGELRRDVAAKKAASSRPASQPSSSGGTPATVKLGSRGAAVTRLQKELREAGHNVAVDGSFGPQTLGAVKSFQRSRGLAVDGVVGPKTWGALIANKPAASAPAPRPPSSNAAIPPTVKLGSKGANVTKLQKELRESGFSLAVDGSFGPQTLGAVKNYQRSRGLVADGVVGPKTWSALLANKPASSSPSAPIDSNPSSPPGKPSVIWSPSPNYNSRGGADIDTIVLHHTASNSASSDLSWMKNPASSCSAHYLVDKNGTIYQLVGDEKRAWHAGTALFQGATNINSRSLGIEIVNPGNGTTPFTEAQYKALEKLVPYLAARYKVPLDRIVGHKDVAWPRGRKTDPARNFDMGRIKRAADRVV